MSESRSPLWFVHGNIKVLMICRLLWSWTTSIVYPFFSLYILALGGTSREIGLINSLGILSGMLLYPLGGYIADHSGRVKIIGYATIAYAVSHLFFVIAQDWRMIALGQFIGQLFLFYIPAMNALEADSLPPDVRGRGFAIMMAVPGAIRVVAPSIGGWLIQWINMSVGLSENEALVLAVRWAWTAATVTGIFVGFIRLKFLEETVQERAVAYSRATILTLIREAYSGVISSVRWMNPGLRVILLIEMLASMFIAMSAPFYVVYAKQVIGLTEYQWGLVMLLSGIIGIIFAFPMGSLVDKIGSRKMIILGMVLAPVIIFTYPFSKGFSMVVLVLSAVSIINSIMMPAFSTLIANIIPRERRGRLYSLIGERGILISFGNFWGGGFLLFIPAAVGSYMGGMIYALNPVYPSLITAGAMFIALILVFLFVREPKEVMD